MIVLVDMLNIMMKMMVVLVDGCNGYVWVLIWCGVIDDGVVGYLILFDYMFILEFVNFCGD